MFRGVQRGGRDLVEQGLEEVMIPAVQERHFHGRLAERARGGQAAEPAADDHDFGHVTDYLRYLPRERGFNLQEGDS
jgi:hypothetical protein